MASLGRVVAHRGRRHMVVGLVWCTMACLRVAFVSRESRNMLGNKGWDGRRFVLELVRNFFKLFLQKVLLIMKLFQPSCMGLKLGRDFSPYLVLHITDDIFPLITK